MNLIYKNAVICKLVFGYYRLPIYHGFSGASERVSKIPGIS